MCVCVCVCMCVCLCVLVYMYMCMYVHVCGACDTRPISDVPLIYGNAVEYNYQEKVQSKTQASLAVMLISNCGGFNSRLQVCVWGAGVGG